jgi:hypothetical protein
MSEFPSAPPSNKCYDLCWACGPIIGMFSVLGLFASGIAYIVYSIIALADISHRSIKDECPFSNIWIFLILTLILGLTNHMQNCKQLSDDNQKWGKIVCGSIIQLGFTSWGAWELWGVHCVDTSNSVYDMVEIYVIASYIISGLLLILATVFTVAFIMKD